MKLSLKRSLVLPVVFAIAPLCAMPDMQITPAPAGQIIVQQNHAPQPGLMTRVANHVYRNADAYAETAISAISLGIWYFWFMKPRMEENRKFYAGLEKMLKTAKEAGVSLPNA